MTNPPTSIRIVALGSPHGDDRVAWVVAERLASEPALRGSVFKIDSPYQLVDHLSAGCRVIILDACHSGVAEGTVFCFDVSQFDELLPLRFSTHGGSIRDTLRLAEALGYSLAAVVILAVEIQNSAPGAELTQAGYRSARLLEERLRKELVH